MRPSAALVDLVEIVHGKSFEYLLGVHELPLHHGELLLWFVFGLRLVVGSEPGTTITTATTRAIATTQPAERDRRLMDSSRDWSCFPARAKSPRRLVSRPFRRRKSNSQAKRVLLIFPATEVSRGSIAVRPEPHTRMPGCDGTAQASLFSGVREAVQNDLHFAGICRARVGVVADAPVNEIAQCGWSVWVQFRDRFRGSRRARGREHTGSLGRQLTASEEDDTWSHRGCRDRCGR